MPALGYLITFSTYGSHLHGDERGSFRAPAVVQVPNAAIAEHRRSLLTAPPVRLDAPMREVVLRAIVSTCEHRGWQLSAAHVRTEHVHAVVRGLEPPERMMNSLKAWPTRYLRETRLVRSDARVWTRHGSTLWLWNDQELTDAARYVHERQGEPLARYP